MIFVARLLGLDVGERRIGVAVSDPGASFALPLHSVDGRNARAAIDEIGLLARDHEVGAVVIGLPLSLSGDDSAQTDDVRAFAGELGARLKLPVHLWDERFSTQEAMRRVSETGPRGRGGRRSRGREADTDALAASIILQAYLDHQRLAPAGP